MKILARICFFLLLLFFLGSLMALNVKSEERQAIERQAIERQAIFGGFAIRPPQWLAYIEVESRTGVYACSGSLIAPDTSLTAAHCLLDASGEYIDILVDGRWYSGIQYNYSPFYTPEYHGVVAAAPYDVAYIKLDRDVVDATPIGLAADFLLSKDQIAYAFGFGANEKPKQKGVLSVRIGAFPFSFRRNAGVWESTPYSPANTICGGDSGGPAVKYVDGIPIQVGINAYAKFAIDRRGVCSVPGGSGGSGFVDTSSSVVSEIISRFGPRWDLGETGKLASRIAGFVPNRPTIRGRKVSYASYPGATYETFFLIRRALVLQKTAGGRVPQRVKEVRYRITANGVSSHMSASVRVPASARRRKK